MPSKNPRLSVVLPPALAATLAALSKETGDSSSSIVRSLLEQAAPALERMLELVKAAKAAQGQIGAGMAESMHRVVEDLHDAIAIADSRSKRVLGDLVAQAEEVKGRRRPRDEHGAAGHGAGTAAALSTPVPVTRGSGHPGKPVKRGKKEGVQAAKVAANGVSQEYYAAMAPGGKRVLLPVGKHFGRGGVVKAKAKGVKRGGV